MILSLLSPKQCQTKFCDFMKIFNDCQSGSKFRIRNMRKTMAVVLLKEYRNCVHVLIQKGYPQPDDSLPSLGTNRKELARMIACSERSVYDHLLFLESIGFLQKRFHGRQHNFELWINPYFMSDLATCPPIQFLTEIKKPETPLFLKTVRQILPPISSCEIQENNNHYKRGVKTVEKPSFSKSSPFPPQFSEFSSSDTRNCQREKKEFGFDSSLDSRLTLIKPNFSQEMAAGRWSSDENSAVSSRKSPIETYAYKLVDDFWVSTKKNFYSETYFSQKHEAEIINILRNDVFENFIGVTQSREGVFKRFLDLMECQEKALRNAKKHHWTSFLPPKLYFSKSFYKEQMAKNEKGSFHYTIEWHRKDVTKIKEADKLRLLQTAKNNISKCISPKGRKDISSLFGITLYYCERINRLCDARITEEFQNFILNHQKYNYGNY